MSLIANRWADAGREVSIITLASTASDAYPLDRRVRRVALEMMIEPGSLAEAIALNLRRLRALRRSIRSLGPDVVISFNSQLNVLTLLACRGLRLPVVISERVHPPSHDIGVVWGSLRRLTYPLAEAVIVQSEKARNWARTLVPSRRIYVIPNPVGSIFVDATEPSHHPRLPFVLAVGRLVPQKGFDLLIRAFGAIVHRHPRWSLMIIGQGPDKDALSALAAKLLPPDTVAFPGNVHDPERYYRAAGLFVLASRFEGFPNVLLEAMASGCAVVAADCLAGPSEIIHQGDDGVLVPPEDVDSLAHEMDRLMGDAAERARLGARARGVGIRFRLDSITALWDDVIGRVRRPAKESPGRRM